MTGRPSTTVRRGGSILGWSPLRTAVLAASVASAMAACDRATSVLSTSGAGTPGAGSPSAGAPSPSPGTSTGAPITGASKARDALIQILADSSYETLTARTQVVTGTDGRTATSGGSIGISLNPAFIVSSQTPAGGGTYQQVTLGDGTTCARGPDGKQHVTNGTAPPPKTAFNYFDYYAGMVEAQYLTASAPPLGSGPSNSVVIEGTLPTPSTPQPGQTIQASTLTVWADPANGHLVAAQQVLKYLYTTAGVQHTQSQQTTTYDILLNQPLQQPACQRTP